MQTLDSVKSNFELLGLAAHDVRLRLKTMPVGEEAVILTFLAVQQELNAILMTRYGSFGDRLGGGSASRDSTGVSATERSTKVLQTLRERADEIERARTVEVQAQTFGAAEKVRLTVMPDPS